MIYKGGAKAPLVNPEQLTTVNEVTVRKGTMKMSKKYVLKNPKTGKYWSEGFADDRIIHRFVDAGDDRIARYEDWDAVSYRVSDLMEIGALVREYLPEPKYRVFIRGENGSKLFYGQLYGKKGFWTEEYITGFYGHCEGKCFVITWDSPDAIPTVLRGRECSTDNSVGFLYYEVGG